MTTSVDHCSLTSDSRSEESAPSGRYTSTSPFICCWKSMANCPITEVTNNKNATKMPGLLKIVAYANSFNLR